MPAVLRRLRYLFRRSRFDEELEREIRSHLETRAAELEGDGLALEQACARARREFGSTALAAERTREAWQFRLFEELAADLNYAARISARRPGFTAAAVASIALGIGANTAVFSVVKGFLLGGPPVREPERVVAIHEGGAVARLSYPDYADYRDRVSPFQGVAASYPVVPASFGGESGPERVWGQLVTADYFSVLGAEPQMGRGFRPDEERSRVVVISDGLWRRSFEGDRAIVGRTILAAGARYTVIGVAPRGFHGSLRGLMSDFWIPLGLYPQVVPMLRVQGIPEQMRNYPWLVVNARLKPGISREQAQAGLQAAARQLDRAYPRPGRTRELLLMPAGTFPVALGQIRLLLGALTAVVALVLLAACANVANLLLARSAARETEMSIRRALGAGRGRLLRQSLAESLFLALLGALAGTALAFPATLALSRLQSSFPIPAALDVRIDARVLLFTAGLSVLSALLFGLAPMLPGAARRFGFKNGLAVVQVAVSIVLLSAAGLFLRSLGKASAVPLGFRTQRALLVGFDPRAAGYTNRAAETLFGEVRERAARLPGVESASLVDIMPLSLTPHAAGVARPGSPLMLPADIYGVSAGYFATLGIQLVRGADFDSRRNAGLPPAVINQSLAARLFGNEDPVGHTVAWEGMPHQVIAVAADTKSRGLSEAGVPQIYVALEREYDKFWGLSGVVLAVKTRGEPARMAAAVREAIRQTAPAMAVFDVRTLADHIGRALLVPRVCAWLFAVFGAIGLALAAVGLYGLMSFAVRRRRKEIGIRIALGATPAAILRTVAGRGVALTAAGAAIGLALALAVSRAMAGLLFGVTPHDPAVFAAAPAVLLAVALTAVLVPARRAAHADALESIRYE